MTEFLPENFTFKDGIWYSPESKNTSYDKEGTANCFQVEDSSYWFRHRQNCIDVLIENYCGPHETFADIGGGNGFVTLHLQNKKINAFLIEPSEEAVINAKERRVNNIICANVEHLKNTSFNNAGIFDVLEHIENDRHFLLAISDLLPSGGKLFITVPAFKFLWGDEDDKCGHQRRYTKNELKTLLNETGFTVDRSTYIFSFLLLPVLFLRTIPSKLKLKSFENKKMEDNYEYNIRNPFINMILSWFTRLEIYLIKKNFPIPFGSSILTVCSKR